MAPLLAGESTSVANYYYFYSGRQLLAVSDGRFKYYPAQPYTYVSSGSAFSIATEQGPWLFDLSTDPTEAYDVLDRHPDIAADLQEEFERRNNETAENPRGWQ